MTFRRIIVKNNAKKRKMFESFIESVPLLKSLEVKSGFFVGVFCLFVCFVLSFCLFRATPAVYGGSQARGLIEAVAASLHHSHSNARSKLRLQPTPQLMATPDP